MFPAAVDGSSLEAGEHNSNGSTYSAGRGHHGGGIVAQQSSGNDDDMSAVRQATSPLARTPVPPLATDRFHGKLNNSIWVSQLH